MSDSMQELKRMRIWFHWRWEKDKNGKPTKNPFAANGGSTGTDDAHSNTWVTYGRSHNSAKGKIHLRNRSGEPVTITKEMRYTVTDGHSNIHINSYDDLSQYCRSAGYTYRSGKTV